MLGFGYCLCLQIFFSSFYPQIRQNVSVALDGVWQAGDLLNQVTDVTELGFKWVGLILEYLAELDLIGTKVDA